MSKSYDKKAPCWGVICEVDVSPLVALLDAGKVAWRPVKGMQPNPSTPLLPPEALPIIAEICRHLGTGVTHRAAHLSRIVPGVTYIYHLDGQPSNWITRVHVPIKTSPDCWFMWEEQGTKVFMDRGKAYSFNTMKHHNYGNDGKTDRVHLMFDALQE